MNANSGFFRTPPAVMNLIIINILLFMASSMLGGGGGVWERFYLYFWESPNFRPYQLVTHMFFHASFAHIFFNMFALWMFGRILELDMGTKRFLVYYFVCGLGAAFLQLGANWIEINSLRNAGEIELAARLVNIPMLGASGAVFGLLLAFGMMYPNSIIMLLFPPIPMKAKYFVIIYGLIEVFFGISGRGAGIAHFAHVGGMLWGLLLILWWRKKGVIRY